ncbi:putative adenylyltransferase/sulfurtransferase MoeZ [Corynebacterium atrinae]|uniref:ThiF family adenylyltransferase n=1 Tax=Corynebacterium atrinae TaxID=1336740 RepID=UPI0025B308B0|nr:ThiF family adenylyltransferase [Corynebacterium atrinae]WJY63718.1 putative adenylyltransferase/sulfurtransferase MoeZ [Corynebacterium atrinae]
MSLPPSEVERTARHLQLPGFGMENQIRLHEAHVLVVGAGGLGCPALQSLASAGVGRITIIDDDTISLSNIHRQILFGASDVGQPKVAVAAARLREVQPGIDVTTLPDRLTVANACELIGSVDLVLDGSDSFATKYLIADAAEITGTPLVWGTVLRFHGDVCLFDRSVGLRDLFPEQPRGTDLPDCATAGVLGVTTAVVGALMATEAITFLSGIGTGQAGRLLSYDALAGTTRSFQVSADPSRPRVRALASDYSGGTHALLDEVRAGSALLLDIREPEEWELTDPLALLHPLRLPLSTVTGPEQLTTMLVDAPRVVVYCASGARSARFCEHYADLGFDLVDLPGGVNGLARRA